ncbi:helix-turn-helix domain-containing protein [Tunicatimonas pelagia]|nr:helix-turn-helix domain-containing protein [Tunicatimonas pelagia]WKN46402.1 helix-turn-helix domain-containing protein [Tunicatimonas pelagia]
MLEDPSMADQKIAAIAFDSGFNNLTSFNAAFKAHTQCTPSQYRKQFLTS